MSSLCHFILPNRWKSAMKMIAFTDKTAKYVLLLHFWNAGKKIKFSTNSNYVIITLILLHLNLLSFFIFPYFIYFCSFLLSIWSLIILKWEINVSFRDLIEIYFAQVYISPLRVHQFWTWSKISLHHWNVQSHQILLYNHDLPHPLSNPHHQDAKKGSRIIPSFSF